MKLKLFLLALFKLSMIHSANFEEIYVKSKKELSNNRLDFFIDLPKLDKGSLAIIINIEVIDLSTSQKSNIATKFKFMDQSLGLRINQKDILQRVEKSLKNKEVIRQDILITFDIDGKKFVDFLTFCLGINLKKMITTFKISDKKQDNSIILENSFLPNKPSDQRYMGPVYLIKS